MIKIVRYYAVEFYDPAMHLIHNGVMTPQEAFQYLMMSIDGAAIRMVLSHEVSREDAEEMTAEERGIPA